MTLTNVILNKFMWCFPTWKLECLVSTNKVKSLKENSVNVGVYLFS